ncbi:MAG: WD40 repeat domain-containing protein [Calditrichaeota bacterium]|nr:WD40 repeat domain-containing protein [Calditrichota bacterium]
MKNKNLIKIIALVFVAVFYLTACNEITVTGNEIAWSPDGKYLAFVNLQTNKIYVSKADKTNEKIIPIDEKVRSAQFLRWSADGKFLMYLKSAQEKLEVRTYEMAGGKSQFVGKIAARKIDKTLQPTSPPIWETPDDQILFVEETGNGKLRLLSISAFGEAKKIIFEKRCQKISPVWVSRNKSILFSVEGASDRRSNGIWTTKSDDSRPTQIYRTENLFALKISPQGDQIGFAISDETSGAEENKIFVSDIQCKNPKRVFQTKQKIEQIDWSPDGQKIACVVSDDDKRNIFVVDAQKNQTVKLTFDNVQQYFGWQSRGKLYFTIRYPESLVELSGTRKDEKELNEIITGKEIKHQLICFDGKNFKKMGNNMVGINENPVSGKSAYYLIAKTNFLASEVYLMTVSDSLGDVRFFPESTEENLLTADQFLATGKNEKAIHFLNQYWGLNLRTGDLENFFGIDELFQPDKPDSVKLEKLTDALVDGAFVRSILALQRSGMNDRANAVIDQFANFASHYFAKNSQKYDEMVWSFIVPYSRLGQFELGSSTIDRFLKAAPLDSVSQSYLFFAQAIFSYEQKKYSLCVEKLRQSANLLPVSQNEVEPYNSLLTLCLKYTGFKDSPENRALFEVLTSRFPHGKGSEVTYELMGDSFAKNGRKKQALSAYKKSLIDAPNEARVWQKIFQLQQ